MGYIVKKKASCYSKKFDHDFSAAKGKCLQRVIGQAELDGPVSLASPSRERSGPSLDGQFQKIEYFVKKPEKGIHSEAHALAKEISEYCGEPKKFAMYLGVIKNIGLPRTYRIFAELRQAKDVETPGKLFLYLSSRTPAQTGPPVRLARLDSRLNSVKRAARLAETPAKRAQAGKKPASKKVKRKSKNAMDIVKEPNKILHNKLKKIEEITPEIKALISDMKKSLTEARGVGLAGNQVGQDLQIFVIDENLAKENKVPDVFINPEITEYSRDQAEMEEGCLSIPDYWVQIKRSKKIKIKALDENGKKIKIKARGFLARVLQHEYDHLQGVLIKDRAKI